MSNVRKGDLAVMVSGDDTGRNIGTIFSVGNPLGNGWYCTNLNTAMVYDGMNVGRIVPPGHVAWAEDCDLRPLRDQEGLDEQLAIARANGNDVPQPLVVKEKEHAPV